MKIRAFTSSLVFLMLLIVSLSGCINSGDKETTPIPTTVDTPSAPASTATEPSTTSGGLTYEENLRINPPPPRNLTGTHTSGLIILSWDIPEKVNIPHNYSDINIQYKIYRGTIEQNMSYLASTSGLTFRDTDITNNQKYFYEITAVHDGVIESVPTQAVII
jgi:fibronectin type 3 domain-containing protein